MAEKRKSVPKKNNTNNDIDVRAKESLRYDIIIIVSIAVSIVLFIGNLGFSGRVLDTISRFFFGLIGLISYALPFFIFFFTLFLIANRTKLNAIRSRCIFFALILLCLCIFFELVKSGGDIENPGAAYLSSFSEKNGGGLFGGLIAFLLFKGFGTAAAFIITIALIILFVVLFMGRSVFSRAEKKTDILRKKMSLQRQERQKRREIEEEKRRVYSVSEDRERRSERHLRGVSLQTALSDEKNGEENGNEKVHEVSVEPSSVSPLMSTGERTLRERRFSDEMHELTMPLEGMGYEETVLKDERTALVRNEEDAKIQGEEKAIVRDDESAILNGDEKAALEEEKSALEEEKPVRKKRPSSSPAPTPPEETRPVTENKVSKDNAFETKSTTGSNEYVFPVIDLLNKPKSSSGKGKDSSEALFATLQKTLDNFGVDAKVTNYVTGPSVTRFEIELKTGVKVAKLTNLENDIKLNLAVSDIRIEAPIPGKAAVGIEVPNKEARPVTFRELMECSEFKEHKSKIAFAAGRDIAGNAIISDIAKMPHLLIAGATGSGKSVCINTIIMSILYKATPSEVKFIMIDPKVVELSIYRGIPHLLSDVVTDPKKAAAALNWAVAEMTKRYKQFADAAVRDMKSYNEKVEKGEVFEEGIKVEEKLPQIVVIVDELTDLMMVAGKEVETSICRLAQLARAAGIHLIIATQRPSADVITGLIKANIPSRIAFMVSSGIDSRVILDMNGAEKLLGKGDMLYAPQGLNKPLRVQGCFVSDEEVSNVVNFIKDNNSNVIEEAARDREIRESEIESHIKESGQSQGNVSGQIDNDPDSGFSNGRDSFFAEAGRFITEKGKGSIGMLQRKFRIGFNRAARIVDQLEEAGIIGPEMGTKPRTALMKLPEFEEWLKNEEVKDEN